MNEKGVDTLATQLGLKVLVFSVHTETVAMSRQKRTDQVDSIVHFRRSIPGKTRRQGKESYCPRLSFSSRKRSIYHQ